MNLMNIKVRHKVFGDGIIVAKENSYITVKFCNDEKLPLSGLEKYHDEIWLVQGDESSHVVGISKDVKFLNTRRTVSLNPIYSDGWNFCIGRFL